MGELGGSLQGVGMGEEVQDWAVPPGTWFLRPNTVRAMLKRQNTCWQPSGWADRLIWRTERPLLPEGCAHEHPAPALAAVASPGWAPVVQPSHCQPAQLSLPWQPFPPHHPTLLLVIPVGPTLFVFFVGFFCHFHSVSSSECKTLNIALVIMVNFITSTLIGLVSDGEFS